MEHFLFDRPDFSDFDHSRACHVGGGKDALLLVRVRRGYVHCDGDEHERACIGRSRLYNRDNRTRYSYSRNSDIEPNRHRLEWKWSERYVCKQWVDYCAFSSARDLLANSIDLERCQHMHGDP